MKTNKCVISGAFLFAFMLLFSGLSPQKVYAENLLLTGDTEGLKISSNNSENPLAMLFSLEKMTPGDSVSSTITIENLYEYAFTLSVEVKDLHDNNNGLNLSDQFIITVEQDGIILANFPKTNGTYVFPNKFTTNSKSVLKFTVNLPGAVGNEYQNTTAELQWIFKAERSETPDKPDPPTPPPPGPTPKPPSPGPTPKPPGPTPKPTPSPKTTDEPDEVLPWFVEISDDPVPLGLSDIAIEDSGSKTMPKTGEVSLWVYVLVGIPLVIIGFVLIIGKQRATNLMMAVKNLYKKRRN